MRGPAATASEALHDIHKHGVGSAELRHGEIRPMPAEATMHMQAVAAEGGDARHLHPVADAAKPPSMVCLLARLHRVHGITLVGIREVGAERKPPFSEPFRAAGPHLRRVQGSDPQAWHGGDHGAGLTAWGLALRG